MGERISHVENLRDELHGAGEHAKRMIDHVIRAACLWLEDHLAETRARAVEASRRSAAEIAPAHGVSNEPLMTVEEMAGYLKMKPQTLRDWAKKGRIPYEPINSEIRFRRSVIDRWIDENRAKKSSPPQSDAVVKSDRTPILRPQNQGAKSNGRV